MASKPLAPSGRRSWRESPAPSGGSASQRGSKTPLRIFTGAVLAALLGLAVWLLMPPKPEPTTHFVALTTGKSDRWLSLPPILFEKPTLAPLQELDDAKQTFRYVEPATWQGLSNINEIRTRLAALAPGEQDRLVVYVSGHGVSDDGEAYVLGPGFDLLAPTANRYSAAKLIDAVAEIDCGAKLIVFDCSRLAVLPRLGMMLNEFSSIVAQKANETNDPDLWVITAASDLETSPLGLAERRSVLGSALVRTLRGEAVPGGESRGDADRDLTIAELAAALKTQCLQATVAAPVPQLTYCGNSRSRAADRVILRIPRLKESAAAKDAAPAGKTPARSAAAARLQAPDGGQAAAGPSQPSATSPTETEAATADGASPAPNQAATPPAKDAAAGSSGAAVAPSTAPASSESPPASAEPAPAPVPPTTPGAAQPESRPEPRILQAWRLRDAIEGAGSPGSGDPSPIGYAPQAWNELNATLVSLGLQSIERPKDVEADIAGLLDSLKSLEQGRQPPARASDLVKRLSDAARQYESSEQRKQLLALREKFARALVDFRRGIFSARQFVEWHAAAHLSPGGAGDAETVGIQIGQLLDDLTALDAELADIESVQRRSWKEAEQWAAKASAASDLVERIEQSIVGATNDGPSSDRGGDPLARRRAENVLTTPLASAVQRQSLEGGLRKNSRTYERSESQPRWSSAVAHLRLQAKLVALIDPDWAADEGIADYLSSSISDDESGRATLRAAGAKIGSFYRELPARTAGGAAKAPDERTLEKLFLVMHPKDASVRSNSGSNLLTAAFLTPRFQPPAEVRISGPGEKILAANEPTILEWTFDIQHARRPRITYQVGKFDDRLDVRLAGSRPAALPTGSAVLPADANSLSLSVSARAVGDEPLAVRRKKIPVFIKVFDGDEELKSETVSAAVVLPRTEWIELTAQCVEPPMPQAGGKLRESIQLHPFPNRPTTFSLSVANHSDEPKKLQVKLWSIPSLDGETPTAAEDGLPAGRVYLHDQLHERLAEWVAADKRGGKLLADVQVDAPKSGVATPIVLKAPEPPKPPAAEPPAEQPKADAAPAPPPEKPDISQGLLCEISDLGEPGAEPERRWIEIVPLRPVDYMKIDPVFDAATREVRFEVAAKSTNALGIPTFPPEVPKQKIVVKLTCADQPWGEQDEAIASPGRTYRLNGKVGGNSGAHDFELRVDDYPRADLQRVYFDNGRIEDLRDLPLLVIDEVGMIGEPKTDATPEKPERVYRKSSYARIVKVDPKLSDRIIDADVDSAFDVSEGSRPIRIKLRFNAPRDQRCAVSLSWFDPDGGEPLREVRWIHGDRRVESTLEEITEQGALRLLTTVRDYEVMLTAPEEGDKRVVLRTELWIDGQSVDYEVVPIVFDKQPPKFTVDVPERVRLGSALLPASMRLKDISGVSKIEAWVTPEPPKSVDELKPDAAVIVPVVDISTSHVDPEHDRDIKLSIPISEKLPADIHFLTLRVTDGSGQTRCSLDQQERYYRFEVKAPDAPPPPGPYIGTVEGQVVFDTGRPAIEGLTVTAKDGPTAATAKTTAGGHFTMEEVEEGAYTFVVEGRARSGKVSGELKATLKTKPQYRLLVPIKFDLGGQKPQPSE